jgi:diaminopimelate epimerase
VEGDCCLFFVLFSESYCLSGACAIFAALRGQGLVGAELTVCFAGGEVCVSETAEGIAMTGPAVSVFEGRWRLEENTIL